MALRKPEHIRWYREQQLYLEQIEMSWKAEVIADNSGKWVGNALVFATKVEADAYVSDLHGRWSAVKDERSVETDAPVNYKWKNGRAVSLEKAA